MLEVAGETLLARAVRVANGAGLDPVFAVVPSDAAWVSKAQALDCVPLENKEAEEGLAASIRAGVRGAMALPSVIGAVLMTCDQVLLTPEHLRALCVQEACITGSRYAGKVAVPAYFPQSHFEALLALGGDTGARELLRGVRTVQAEELALDIDVEVDVQKAKAIFGHDIVPPSHRS